MAGLPAHLLGNIDDGIGFIDPMSAVMNNIRVMTDRVHKSKLPADKKMIHLDLISQVMTHWNTPQRNEYIQKAAMAEKMYESQGLMGFGEVEGLAGFWGSMGNFIKKAATAPFRAASGLVSMATGSPSPQPATQQPATQPSFMQTIARATGQAAVNAAVTSQPVTSFTQQVADTQRIANAQQIAANQQAAAIQRAAKANQDTVMRQTTVQTTAIQRAAKAQQDAALAQAKAIEQAKAANTPTPFFKTKTGKIVMVAGGLAIAGLVITAISKNRRNNRKRANYATQPAHRAESLNGIGTRTKKSKLQAKATDAKVVKNKIIKKVNLK